MSRVGFESTISAGERRQAYTLDLAANGAGFQIQVDVRNIFFVAR